MKSRSTALMALAAFGLSACAGDGYGGPRYGTNLSGMEVGGALLGAAAGGLVGSRFGKGHGQLAATAAGTLLGAFVGTQIGRGLEQSDRVYAAQATERALDYGRPGDTINWNNPETGAYGNVRPGPVYGGPTYGGHAQAYCREYEQTIYVGGRAERGYGTACQQPDGSWRIEG